MRIALDQDEVLCHWTKKVVQWLNEDFGTGWPGDPKGSGPRFSLDQVKTWQIEDSLGDEIIPYVRSYMRSTLFYPKLEPIEGAVEGVRSLIQDGHEVMIVTAVPRCAPQAYDGKMTWVRDHMPFFDVDDFMSVKKKYRVDADVLVDDGTHNLNAWTDSKRIAVAFDRPWNRDARTPYRARDWKELLEVIARIEEEHFS
jgi:5'(3')-deoxyribonucleotidase